jgi:transposase
VHPRARIEERAAYFQKVHDFQQQGRPFVYADESGFAHDMPRTYGYSSKGKRCYGKHDWGAKGRTNVIGALLGKKLLCASLFQTTVNREVFTAWLKQDLIPRLPANSVFVMDNASFHKGVEIQKILQDAGHTLLYLPPYSPDLNPIEKKWAQAKSLRRKMGGTVAELFLHPQICSH